uniref:Uncharacterized protein n=1 Tax=Oryza punctata TaxID=4537 RepID=A0A0E0K057_ORYPU
MSPSRRPGHHGRSKRCQSRLPRELGSYWVGFLEESVRLSHSDMESSNNIPTSPHSPRDIFIVMHQEMEADRLEGEEEERRIKQQQEDLQWRMEEFRQRDRATRDAILQTKLGEHDVFMTPSTTSSQPRHCSTTTTSPTTRPSIPPSDKSR